MNPAKRERHKQREQLHRARWKLDQCHTPQSVYGDPECPRDEGEWRDLIEQRIQEAMATGDFEDLPGKGKPLNLTRNPYLDPSLELAYGLLENSGYTPEWIARDKEIREGLEAARARLRVAWTQPPLVGGMGQTGSGSTCSLARGLDATPGKPRRR